MNFKDYILRHLPGKLRNLTTGIHLADAVGDSLDDLKARLRLMVYRGCATRYTSEETAYYATAQRPIDVKRIGHSRNLKQRPTEIDVNFETRVAAFPLAVFYWGTRKGIEDETERTDLEADHNYGDYGIKELATDDQRWIILDEAHQALESEANISHIFKDGVIYNTGTASVTNGTKIVTFADGAQIITGGVEADDIFFNGDKSAKMVIESVDSETQLTLVKNWPGPTMSGDPYECRPDDPTVRGCRMYEDDEELFIFILKLNDPGSVDFSKEEIKEIVKAVKPSPCKAFVIFPGEAYAEEV